MRRAMVTRDVETFVGLGRAVALAAAEEALAPQEARELTAGLVAGILSGCMEFDTYARIHDAMARLLDRAFAQGAAAVPAPSPVDAGAPPDEPLGVYLEVVGEAWEQVGPRDEACEGLKGFAARAFDLGRARFGNGSWFRAPLRVGGAELLRLARAAGLLVVSVAGPMPAPASDGCLADPARAPAAFRVVLGWGDRRTALDAEG